jgi:beta-xylosidase
VGVRINAHGKREVVMVNTTSGKPVDEEIIPVDASVVYFKIDCDFRDRVDTATFQFSLDGKQWKTIGTKLKMVYTLPHFMGYRFALFNYATQEVGGYADFDFFRIHQ